MGYIYEAMDRAKEAITNAFNKKVEKYDDVFAIIDRRWDSQLHKPLRAAAYFLNPEYFYSNPEIGNDKEVMDGFVRTLERLVPSIETQEKISDELSLYKGAEKLFGTALAKKKRTLKSPAE